MGTDKTNQNWRTVLVATLGIFIAGLVVAGVSYRKIPRDVSTDIVATRSKLENSKPLDYRVWRFPSPADKNRFTIAVASVGSKHFNREDMTALAAQLNKEFTQETRVKVGLVDDENTARLFVRGGANYPTYEKAERGRYYLDRTKCEEYIQFSTQSEKPRNEVTIKLNCSRPQR